MTTQFLAPGHLLRDTFTSAKTVYRSLLLLYIPISILPLLFIEISKSLFPIVNVIYSLSISLIFSGAAIFYAYQNLNRREVTPLQSLKIVINKLIQLILLRSLLIAILAVAFFLLVIPGIYLSIRLFFADYAILIENYSAINAIRRSWRLTENHWWSLFFAFLVQFLATVLPVIFIAMIISPFFGVSSLHIFLDRLPALESASTIFKGASAIFAWLIGPVSLVYSTIIFMILQTLDRQSLNET